MKKIFAIILSFIMIIGIVPTFAFAQENATSGKCGDNITWNYDDSTKTISVVGTGDMYNYEGKTGPFDSDLKNIEYDTIVISDGVTTIGDYSFL